MRILQGDVNAMLATLPDGAAQTCVTSPPYYGLRAYLPDDHPLKSFEIGGEATLQEYVAKLVNVFRGVRRVLRDDGSVWLNLGDSYAGGGGGDYGNGLNIRNGMSNPSHLADAKRLGVAPKNLLGIPWRVAFALQDDGWYLRSDIIWAKNNPMPESVTDRPTKSHEYVFLLSKQERYFYDADAIREPVKLQTGEGVRFDVQNQANQSRIRYKEMREEKVFDTIKGANRRSVWTIATKPYAAAHFATFPPELPRRCILAGTKAGDTVLDPFCGAGTTGLVASQLGRDFIGIELNPDYIAMSKERIRADAPLFAGVTL
jgi:site-specific DNA-methyltransferase (cytosine-N4-specific)